MLSSLTLSPSVSTQSEAAWEAHTITRRAAPLLIRPRKGEEGVAVATSLHLQCTSLTYGLINRRLPSLSGIPLITGSQEKGGAGRLREEERGELSLLSVNQQRRTINVSDDEMRSAAVFTYMQCSYYTREDHSLPVEIVTLTSYKLQGGFIC